MRCSERWRIVAVTIDVLMVAIVEYGTLGMYSHVFCFRFEESASPAGRMQFLAELFELPEKNGGKASDIYWCFLDYDGFVEFYSNTPNTTELLENRLHEAEAKGMLKQISPGLGSELRFLSRLLGALIIGVVKLIFGGRK